MRARPDLWLTMLLVFFVATFGMNFQVTDRADVRGVFHTGAWLFGVASAVFALGALGGALLAARRARPSMRLMLVTAFAFGVLEVATGLMPAFWSFLVMLVPTGMALLMFTTAANSATQLATTPGGARPGDGPVHAGLPGRGAARARRWSAGWPSSSAPGSA